MQVTQVDPPAQAEMQRACEALARLAEELDRLSRDVDDLRPHAQIALLLAVSLQGGSFDRLISAIEFCDIVAASVGTLDGGHDVPQTRMVRRAQSEVVNAFQVIVEGVRLRADRAAPTVDIRRPSSTPPAPTPRPIDHDRVRTASEALLAAYDASQTADPDEGPAIKDIDRLFEDLRKALGK